MTKLVFILFALAVAFCDAQYDDAYDGFYEGGERLLKHLFCSSKYVKPAQVVAYENCEANTVGKEIELKCQRLINPNDQGRREVACERTLLNYTLEEELEECVRKERDVTCKKKDCSYNKDEANTEDESEDESQDEMFSKSEKCRHEVLKSVSDFKPKLAQKYWEDFKARQEDIRGTLDVFQKVNVSAKQIQAAKLCNAYTGKIDEMVLKKCSLEIWPIVLIVYASDIDFGGILRMNEYGKKFTVDIRQYLMSSFVVRRLIDRTVLLCALEELKGNLPKNLHFKNVRPLWITKSIPKLHPFDVIERDMNADHNWLACLRRIMPEI